MPITEKQAKELCNSVEILLVNDSFPKNLKQLTPKKIQIRHKNALKAAEYWKKRYETLKEDLDSRKKSGKLVPLLPELKMQTFQKKSQLFYETAERYRKALSERGLSVQISQTRKSISKVISKTLE